MVPKTESPVSAADWRRLYLAHPSRNLRDLAEFACPGALDGLDDVVEQSMEDTLLELRQLYQMHPNPGLADLIAGLERRVDLDGPV